MQNRTQWIQGFHGGTARGRLVAWLAALAVAASVAACSDVVGPVERLDVAVIGYYFEDAPRITIPDTVSLGEAFTVTVESYGNGCVRLGRTELHALPGGAVVTPLDFLRTGGPCEDILLIFHHEASLSLNRAGPNRVLVRGREVPDGPIRDFVHEVWVR